MCDYGVRGSNRGWSEKKFYTPYEYESAVKKANQAGYDRAVKEAEEKKAEKKAKKK